MTIALSGIHAVALLCHWSSGAHLVKVQLRSQAALTCLHPQEFNACTALHFALQQHQQRLTMVSFGGRVAMYIGPTSLACACLMQAGNANYLQKALAGKARNFQIIEEDAGEVRVENVVQLGPLLAIKAGGTCSAQGASRTLVRLDDIRAELGPLRFGVVFFCPLLQLIKLLSVPRSLCNTAYLTQPKASASD